MIYGLNDRPPPGRAVVLALQHVLTMFGATVSVPLLLGPKMGMDAQQMGLLISSVMLCSGLATVIQSTWGSRLPIVQGVSFSFLGVFLAIIDKGTHEHWEAAVMMQYIGGAIIVGAVVEMVIGFTGLIGWLRKAISPVVIGPVIMLIGLALFKHGAPKAATHMPVGALTIVLIIIFSLVLAPKMQFFRIFPILSAVVVVVGLCWVFSETGIFHDQDTSADGQPIPAGQERIAPHPSYVDLAHVESSPWIRIDPREVILPWGWPKFHIGFIIAALAGYMASMIESFGDYHACSQMAGGGDPTPQQISRGIGCEGVGCFLTGILGGFSSTSYSENIGVVGLTKVGSRYVVQIAGVALILLGIFGKFGAVAAAIPGPVVGGLYCALFGLIAAVGIQQLAKADLSSDRNLFIAGFSLFMGLSVPAFFDGTAAVIYSPGADELFQSIFAVTQKVVFWFDPEAAAESIHAINTSLRSIITSIGTTGMAVAAICGIVLDNLIPGSARERGLEQAG